MNKEIRERGKGIQSVDKWAQQPSGVGQVITCPTTLHSAVLQVAARALGRLVKSGAARTSDIVDKEVWERAGSMVAGATKC